MTYNMSLKEQIYKYDRVIGNLKGQIERNESISLKNKELISEYHNSLVARGISKARQTIVLQCLLRLAAVSKVDFDKVKKKDIEAMMAELQSGDKNYSAWTIETSKAILKQFYRWHLELETTDPLPDFIRWLNGNTPGNTLTKKDLVTKEEVGKMIATTGDLMQKALISTHFEAANRPGETLSMKIGDVTFNEDYVHITVSGKTGVGEKFLLHSYDLLRAWIDTHPHKQDKNAPLWIVMHHFKNRKGEDVYGKCLTLSFLGRIFKKAAERAGISKRIFSYLYRHSAGTMYYGTIGEALAKKQMLHAADTKMAKVYNHLSSEDLLKGLKKANGMKDDKEEERSGICWKCRHPNTFGTRICSKCASPLDPQAAMVKKAAIEEKEQRYEQMFKAWEIISRKPQLIEAIQRELKSENQ